MPNTSNPTYKSYKDIIQICQSIFEKKTVDYGTSWRILRLPSITDQIMIKAQRVRNILEKGTQLINEDIDTEFMGIINYSIIALIQLSLPIETSLEITYEELEPYYIEIMQNTQSLVVSKNHDYAEAWKTMRLDSIVDIILMRLLRIKRIEDNKGQTLISEGVISNYQDIINYAVFALLKIVC